jgi:hypothetical protein
MTKLLVVVVPLFLDSGPFEPLGSLGRKVAVAGHAYIAHRQAGGAG